MSRFSSKVSASTSSTMKMFESSGYVTSERASGASTLALRSATISKGKEYLHAFSICSPNRPMPLNGLMLGRFFR